MIRQRVITFSLLALTGGTFVVHVPTNICVHRRHFCRLLVDAMCDFDFQDLHRNDLLDWIICLD